MQQNVSRMQDPRPPRPLIRQNECLVWRHNLKDSSAAFALFANVPADGRRSDRIGMKVFLLPVPCWPWQTAQESERRPKPCNLSLTSTAHWLKVPVLPNAPPFICCACPRTIPYFRQIVTLCLIKSWQQAKKPVEVPYEQGGHGFACTPKSTTSYRPGLVFRASAKMHGMMEPKGWALNKIIWSEECSIMQRGAPSGRPFFFSQG